MRMRKQGKSSIWSVCLFAVCVAASLVVPALAGAEESEFYAPYSRCPTGLPEMNDPLTEEAACFSNVSHHGTIAIGNIRVRLAGPTDLQFAVAGVEEERFVVTVPGTTTMTAAPVFIPNPFYTVSEPVDEPVPPVPEPKKPSPASQSPEPGPSGAPAPPVQPVTKKTKKSQKKKKAPRKHRKHKKKAKKHGRHHLHAREGAQTAALAPKIQIDVELAGDVTEFDLLVAAGEETGKVALRIPLKFHLVGDPLGPNCYVGSDANPIVLHPRKEKAETTFFFGQDPNGFNIHMRGSGGTRLEDKSFAVPVASGCNGLAAEVNDMIGLPAKAGQSEAILTDNEFQFIGAGYDGVAPEGGAELQAAFDAAAGE